MTRAVIPSNMSPKPPTLAEALKAGVIGPESRQVRAVVMLQEVDDRGRIIGTRVTGQTATQVFGSAEQAMTPTEHHAGRIEHMAGVALHDLLRQLSPSELVGVFMQAVRKDGGA